MDRDVIIVLGKTGFGKSLWCKLYTTRLDRLYVYDPAKSYPVHWLRAGGLVQYCEAIGYGVKPESEFRLGSFDPDDTQILGNASFISGKCVYVVEEAASVFPIGLTFSATGEKAERWNWLKRLIFFGRHRDCTLVVVAQRAASIPLSLRSQASRVVSFQQHEDDDLKWLAGLFTEYSIYDVTQLERFQCLDWHHGSQVQYSIEASVRSVLGIALDTRAVGVVEPYPT